MTPFASVALFKRDGAMKFKPPRKERSDTGTQAKKSAIRFWRGNTVEPDILTRVLVVREFGGRLEISERGPSPYTDRAWRDYVIDLSSAAQEPHLAACMREIGIGEDDVPPSMPDVLVINGATYRREI